MVSVGNAIMFVAVKQMVEANAKIAKTALIAVGIVATTAANVPGMMDAGEKWKEISNDLGTLTAHLDAALSQGEDWIADDKEAFETSLTNFKGEIEKVKTAAGDVAGALDTMSNVYIVAYTAVIAFAGACLIILIGLVVLLFIPHTSAAARIMIEQIGLLLTMLSGKIAIMLGTLATAMAAMLGAMAYGYLQVRSKANALPQGAEFDQIRIDYRAPTTFEAKTV